MEITPRLKQKLDLVKDQYYVAVKNEHVGRRTLMKEFDVSKSEAIWICDQIRDEDKNDAMITEINDYDYRENGDIYIFHGVDVFGDDTKWRVEGEDIRQMKKDYTSGYTMEQTARRNAVDKGIFAEIKTILDWTHGSLPATDEEVSQRDPDELVDQLLTEQKKYEVAKKLEKKKERQLKKDAEKYREFEYHAQDLLNDLEVDGYDVPQVNINRGTDKSGALVIPIQDAHIGKRATDMESGEVYNMDIAREGIHQGIEDLLSRSERNIDRVYLSIGGDFFHFDDVDPASTTKGTPQTMSDAPDSVVIEGQKIAIGMVDICRQVADKVEVVCIRGNHDKMNSIWVYSYLDAWFRNCDDVVFQEEYKERQARTYGDNLLVFTHGDGLSKSDLVNAVHHEERDKMGGTEHTYIFKGHYHYEEMTGKYNGATIYQTPSISRPDKWHYENGYTGRRYAIGGHLVSEERGVISTYTSPQ